MGRHAGWIAMHSSLAARDVDLCLIPEVDFYMHGPGGVIEHIVHRLHQEKHVVGLLPAVGPLTLRFHVTRIRFNFPPFVFSLRSEFST
eukprot:120909-Prorocentrum_minimum.AAC.1